MTPEERTTLEVRPVVLTIVSARPRAGGVESLALGWEDLVADVDCETSYIEAQEAPR